MPSTSVHLPAPILESLDQLAAETGTSRNRLIVEACREILQKRLTWSRDFFDNGRFQQDDLRLLRETGDDFDRVWAGARKNRDRAPF